MRVASEGNMRPEAFEARIKAVVGGGGKTIPDFDLSVLRQTYEKLDALRRDGRDTIWSYVARNLSRPLHLSSAERRVDVVVDNPPWLAFRYMSKEFQKRFKELAEGERVYVGGKLATQADLSALFFAKSAALYLREGGTIGFVMPLAALTRGQFERFRTGAFYSKKVQFTDAWTFDEGVQPLFPVPSCALFATTERGLSRPTPKWVTAYKGHLPLRDAHEDMADKYLKVSVNAPAPTEASYKAGSPYRKAFRQGATLVPRMLCLVEAIPAGRLGGDPRAPLVKSRRSTQEKEPWKTLDGLKGQVEANFLRPVYLGESILPYRAWKSVLGVIPVSTKGDIFDANMAANRGYLHIHDWMRRSESAWKKYADSDMTLVERWDYHKELSSQFPISKIRVLFAASGTLPCAVVLRDDRAVIEHAVYWSEPNSADEGRYLVAILNSEAARKKVQDMQARGQWGARHFDKVMFTLPMPRFNSKEPLHRDLSSACAKAEAIAAKVVISKETHLQTARRHIRKALVEDGIAKQIDTLVTKLLKK